jgi:hypothetical protein
MARQLNKRDVTREFGISETQISVLEARDCNRKKRRLIRSALDVTFVNKLDHKRSCEIYFTLGVSTSIRIQNLAGIPNFGTGNKVFIDKRNDD